MVHGSRFTVHGPGPRFVAVSFWMLDVGYWMHLFTSDFGQMGKLELYAFRL